MKGENKTQKLQKIQNKVSSKNVFVLTRQNILNPRWDWLLPNLWDRDKTESLVTLSLEEVGKWHKIVKQSKKQRRWFVTHPTLCFWTGVWFHSCARYLWKRLNKFFSDVWQICCWNLGSGNESKFSNFYPSNDILRGDHRMELIERRWLGCHRG